MITKGTKIRFNEGELRALDPGHRLANREIEKGELGIVLGPWAGLDGWLIIETTDKLHCPVHESWVRPKETVKT